MDFQHLLYCGKSDPGRKRDHNEDAFVMLPEHGVFCVADGMGGAEGGELASRAVVEAIEKEFSSLSDSRDAARCLAKAEHLETALNRAGQWINQYARSQGAEGMGTTIVALLFDAIFPNRAVALHAGDSRLYRYRQGRLEQITGDHSLAAMAGVEDEDSMDPAFRAVITRAVGVHENVDLEKTSVDVQENDIFLLCSDGLSRMLPDRELLNLFRKHENVGLPEFVQAMIDGANAAGGKDNITTILVSVGKAEPCAELPAEYDTADEDSDTSTFAPACRAVASERRPVCPFLRRDTSDAAETAFLPGSGDDKKNIPMEAGELPAVSLGAVFPMRRLWLLIVGLLNCPVINFLFISVFFGEERSDQG